jgi:hypothetical protein
MVVRARRGMVDFEDQLRLREIELKEREFDYRLASKAHRLAEFSKIIVTNLIWINSAGLGALPVIAAFIGIGDMPWSRKFPLLVAVGAPFAAGLVAAILCALAAYHNYSSLAAHARSICALDFRHSHFEWSWVGLSHLLLIRLLSIDYDFTALAQPCGVRRSLGRRRRAAVLIVALQSGGGRPTFPPSTIFRPDDLALLLWSACAFFQTSRSTRPRACGPLRMLGDCNGYWYCEMVQRPEGLRLHSA